LGGKSTITDVMRLCGSAASGSEPVMVGTAAGRPDADVLAAQIVSRKPRISGAAPTT
jgi:hypothetical protein